MRARRGGVPWPRPRPRRPPHRRRHRRAGFHPRRPRHPLRVAPRRVPGLCLGLGLGAGVDRALAACLAEPEVVVAGAPVDVRPYNRSIGCCRDPPSPTGHRFDLRPRRFPAPRRAAHQRVAGMTNHGVTMAYNRGEASFIRVSVPSTTAVSGHAFKAQANPSQSLAHANRRKVDSVHNPKCCTTRLRDGSRVPSTGIRPRLPGHVAYLVA